MLIKDPTTIGYGYESEAILNKGACQNFRTEKYTFIKGKQEAHLVRRYWAACKCRPYVQEYMAYVLNLFFLNLKNITKSTKHLHINVDLI